MSENFDGSLTYRDYVVHVFTGILFNVFLVAASYTPDTILPNSLCEMIQKLDFATEIILSLMAISIFFLEGHFLLTIDRFFFVELPSWLYGLRKQRGKMAEKDDDVIGEKSDGYSHVSAPYRSAREKLFQKCKMPFYLLFGKRIIGQKIIRKSIDGTLVKTKNENKKSLSKRYYVLSDFFKGCGLAAWIALFVAVANHNWLCVAALGVVIILAWLRCRFYSRLYVKNRYKKKNEDKDENNINQTDSN